jgi:DNA-binding XRE family transcriptional regulator
MTTAREMAAKRGAQPPAVVETLVRRKRIEHGLTLQEVADAVGLSKGGLSHIEVGNCEPKVGVSIRLARFYETSVEELFATVAPDPS